jgi:hypothetical protein
MDKVIILGVNIQDRIKAVKFTQNVLGNYADIIKTRLGFHELNEDVNSRNGLILLELAGDETRCEILEKELTDIGGVAVKKMVFKV